MGSFQLVVIKSLLLLGYSYIYSSFRFVSKRNFQIKSITIKKFNPFSRLNLCPVFMTTLSDSNLFLSQVDSYIKVSVSKVLQIVFNSDGSQTLTLDNSVLYPEGGGQPYDLGFINKASVITVFKSSNRDINTKSNGTAIDVTISPPIEIHVGDSVECEVDWKRRYDFMQQHTAQHLFSAVAEKLYNADTVGWALGKDTVTVDLQATTLLTATQIEHIERETNEEIRKGTVVSWSVHRKDELERLHLLRGVPKGAAEGLEELRLVNIEGLDSNPCGGTHLKSLGEIQCLKVLGFEKDRNAIRVRWVAGYRALDYFKACVDREYAMMHLLTAPPSNHISVIEKLYQDKKDILKTSKILNDELLSLLSSSMSTYLSSLPSESKYLVYHRSFGDLNFISNLGELLTTNHPDVIVYISVADSNEGISMETKKGKGKVKDKESNLITNTMDYSKPYNLSQSTSGSFVLCGPKERVELLKTEVMTIVNGRGGGRPGRIQGTGNNLENIEQIRSIIMRSF